MMVVVVFADIYAAINAEVDIVKKIDSVLPIFTNLANGTHSSWPVFV